MTFSHNFKNITQNGQNHSCDTIALKRRYILLATYVCKQRVVALLLIELLSKMRKMRTITPPDAIFKKNGLKGKNYLMILELVSNFNLVSQIWHYNFIHSMFLQATATLVIFE